MASRRHCVGKFEKRIARRLQVGLAKNARFGGVVFQMRKTVPGIESAPICVQRGKGS